MSDGGEKTGRPGRLDEKWKAGDWARAFTGIRGGIPMASEQVDVMVRVLGAAAGEGGVKSFLDLGCGDGVLSAAVLARWPGAEATLVDFSGPMIDEARERLSSNRVDLEMADFGGADWVEKVKGRAPFDAVISGYAIHHQDDERKRALYGEVLELLRPGGIFLNMEHVASRSPWVREVAEGHFAESMRAWREKTGAEGFDAEELKARRDREANILSPVEDQCGWLRELGYTDVDCFFKVFELALFGGRRPL